MKYLYSLILLAVSSTVFAQYNTDGLGDPISGVEEVELLKDEQASIIIPDETGVNMNAEAIDFDPVPIPIEDADFNGATKGQFSVSLMGEATYNLPIEVPPGINGMVPDIGLYYNSHATNGIAGYGWNISGLSIISKTGSNKFFDGKNSVVNYSSDDRYMLDGQRLLLKSGVYGKDGAEYQTETYSNLKITSHGNSQTNNGPEYFKVQYPDGNTAFYGKTYNSVLGGIGQRTSTNNVYALTYITNPQNVVIKYNYVNYGHNLLISSITYGYKTSNPLDNVIYLNGNNTITFTYKDRNRTENSYIFNEAINLTKILDKITIKGFSGVGHFTENYRTYQLTYKTSSLGYEQLIKVTETSGDGTSEKKPVSFSYGAISTDTNSISEEVFDAKDQDGIGFLNLSKNNTNLISGNFSGQGRIGFLMHFISTDGNQTTNGNNLYIYDPTNPNNPNVPVILNQSFGTTPFMDVVVSKRLTADNILLPNDGWTTISKTGTSGDGITYQFKSFIYMPSTALNIYPIGQNQSVTMYGKPNARRQFLSGDFNGDGITEIVRMEHVKNFTGSSSNQTNSSVEIFDTKTNSVYTTSNIPIGFNYNIVDTDGDGYDEFVVIRYQNIQIYKFNQTTKKLELYSDENTPEITGERPVHLGDFNGDGKMDFITPAGNNSSNWVFYINKDNGEYEHSTKNINVLFETDKTIFQSLTSFELITFDYIVTDINNDGKTDIVKTMDRFRSSISGINPVPLDATKIWIYENAKFDESTQSASFNIPLSPTSVGSPIMPKPLIAFTNYNKSTYKNELSFISGNKLRILKTGKDNVKAQQLTAINEYNLTTKIKYDVYDEKKRHFETEHPENNDIEDAVVPFESFGENLPTYPKVEMDVVPGLYLVKKVTYDSNKRILIGIGEVSSERKQLFTYGDATRSHNGKGFLGFRGTMSTNIYQGGPTIYDLQDQIKTINIYDLDNNRLINESIVAHDIDWANFFTTPINFISKKTNSYQISNLSNKVFKALNNQLLIKEGLTGIQRIVTSTYDSYSNPLSITETVSGAGETSTLNTVYTYQNNTVNGSYYIGRPLSKTIKMNGAQTSKETYTFNNNLLTSVSKQGATGSISLLETNEYDLFGNNIQKTYSTSGVQPRSASKIYDSTGRFVEKSVDIEGLETNYVYNKNKGWLLSQTNPYGLTNSYEYNAFGMKISETDYLGNSITTVYKTNSIFYLGASFVKTERLYPDGRKERFTIDAWGNKTSEGYTDIEGNWISKSFSYDSQNRLIKQSEPYTSTASQFTTFTYDKFGRPIKTTLPNGKEITASYNGLSTTVDDGIRTKTETKNINNQTKKVVDNAETINYSYNTNGSLKSTSYDGSIISFEYDNWGKKTKVSDPSAGTYTYEYNNFGDLLKETGPNGAITNTYDDTGKILSTSFPGNVINYIYDSSKLLSKVESTTTEGTYQKVINYDNYKRISSEQYITPLGFNYNYSYTFDDLGREVTEEKQVTGNAGTTMFKLKKIFKNGYLWKLQDAVSNTDLKVYNTFNERGQATNITLGNGLSSDYSFDQYGFLTQNSIKQNNVQLYAFNNVWDTQRGNLTSRTNSLFSAGINENFQYDTFDRITSTQTKQGNNIIETESLTYDGKGRILNSNVGDYSYDSSKIYQLKNVDNLNDLSYYQDNPLQEVTYNAKKAPLTIKQQGKENIYFQYDGFNNRTAMYYGNESTSTTESSKVRYYSPKGDIEVNFDKSTNKYIVNLFADGSPYNSTLLYRKENNVSSMYYLHRDYLGSILAITNAAGSIVEKRHFDAWGNVLLVQDGQNNNLDRLTFLDRGYTGHEHLQGVGLINMNARLYDAKLHRFLAPDNYIQDAANSQNFNRYGYVMNNPLKYTDKSGNIFELIAGIANYLAHKERGESMSFWKGLEYFAQGFVAGLISGPNSVIKPETDLFGIIAFFEGAFTGDWSKFKNVGKIYAGRFYLDENKSFIEAVWEGISRYTYQDIQSTIGYDTSLILNLFNSADRVDYLGGATFITNENNPKRTNGRGFTLGNFISIDLAGEITGDFETYVINNPLYMHEYGHYIDSQGLGGAYMAVIGIPSFLSNWKWYSNLFNLNDSDGYYTEKRANRKAAEYFKQYGVDWSRYDNDTWKYYR